MSASAPVFNIPSNSTFTQETAFEAVSNLVDIISENIFRPNNLAKNVKFITSRETGACLSRLLVDLGLMVHDNTEEHEFDDMSALVMMNISEIIKMLASTSDLAKPFGWQIDQIFFSAHNVHQFAGVTFNPVTRASTPKYGKSQSQLIVWLKPYLSKDSGADGLALVPCCNNSPKEGTPFVVSSMCPNFQAPASAVRRARNRAPQMDENGIVVEEQLAAKPLPVIPSMEEILKTNDVTANEMLKYVQDNFCSPNFFTTYILYVERDGKCVTTLNISFDALVKDKVYNILRTANLECCMSTKQTDDERWVATPPEITLVKDLIAAHSTKYACALPAFMELLTDRAPTLLAATGWNPRAVPEYTLYDETTFRGFRHNPDGTRQPLNGDSCFKICIPIAPLKDAPAWRSGPLCCNASKKDKQGNPYAVPHILGAETVSDQMQTEAPAAPTSPSMQPYRQRALAGAAQPTTPVSSNNLLRNASGQRFVPFTQPPRSAAGGGGRTAPPEEEEFVSQRGRSNRGGTSSSSELETLRRRIAELEGGSARAHAGGGATGRR